MNAFECLEEAMEHLSDKGAFLTVRDANGKVNAMTINWGFIGQIWKKPTFIALVRDSRYTHELIEAADSFTISIPFDKSMYPALAICGSKSGRDINKEEAAGISFVPAKAVSSPIVGGCNQYYECKISYTNTIPLDKLALEVKEEWYSDNDYHDVYYGEIVESYGGK